MLIHINGLRRDYGPYERHQIVVHDVPFGMLRKTGRTGDCAKPAVHLKTWKARGPLRAIIQVIHKREASIARYSGNFNVE